jgi:acetyltransferase
MAAVGNPVDVIGDAGADRFTAALDIVTTKSTVDAIIVIVTPQMMTDAPAIAKTIAQYKGVMPIIPVFMGGSVMQSGISVLIENGMVNFASPSSAITALDALILHKKAKTVVIKSATKDVSSHASHMLSYDEMTSLLSQYALTVSGTIARTKDDALRVYDELGGSPVAMKVVSQNVVHKTDVHAVELNVSRLDVHRVWDEIEEKIRGTYLGAEIEGMLLQPMTSGKEVIIGMTRDATFGPVIVFGLGGIFVELLSDVAMRIPPFLHDEARKMIDEIAGIKYLDGFRGSLPVDKDSLAHILVSIGNLAIAHPDITEIDFNPVIVTNEGAHIVDARVMKRN